MSHLETEADGILSVVMSAAAIDVRPIRDVEDQREAAGIHRSFPSRGAGVDRVDGAGNAGIANGPAKENRRPTRRRRQHTVRRPARLDFEAERPEVSVGRGVVTCECCAGSKVGAFHANAKVDVERCQGGELSMSTDTTLLCESATPSLSISSSMRRSNASASSAGVECHSCMTCFSIEWLDE